MQLNIGFQIYQLWIVLAQSCSGFSPAGWSFDPWTTSILQSMYLFMARPCDRHQQMECQSLVLYGSITSSIYSHHCHLGTVGTTPSRTPWIAAPAAPAFHFLRCHVKIQVIHDLFQVVRRFKAFRRHAATHLLSLQLQSRRHAGKVRVLRDETP